MIGLALVERDVVIVACAISSGIHAALTPSHLASGAAAGIGFAGSAVVLAGLAVALTRHSGSAVLTSAALMFVGLIASYGLAVTAGVPFVHPEPEAVDGLGLFTKAVEATGLLAAADLAIPRLRGALA